MLCFGLVPPRHRQAFSSVNSPEIRCQPFTTTSCFPAVHSWRARTTIFSNSKWSCSDTPAIQNCDLLCSIESYPIETVLRLLEQTPKAFNFWCATEAGEQKKDRPESRVSSVLELWAATCERDGGCGYVRLRPSVCEFVNIYLHADILHALMG